jgi:hypothetical protein
MSLPPEKRRRHTHSTRRKTSSNDAVTPPAPESAPVHYVSQTAYDMAEEIFGFGESPGTMHSTVNRNDFGIPFPTETPTLESAHDLVVETNADPTSRLRANVNTISPFEEMAVAASFPLDPAIERIARRLESVTKVAANDFYVVSGLSDTVPSDEWQRTRQKQADLQAQINLLEHGAEMWEMYDQYVQQAIGGTSRKLRTRAQECYNRLTQTFGPAPTILKPASISRALNRLWRDLLINELKSARTRFLSDTTIGLVPYSTNQDIDSIAEQFVTSYVDPFLQRQLQVIEESNYDESPLLWSTLREYFDTFLNKAAEYLNMSIEQRDAQVANEEEDKISCFLGNALELYAQPEFLRAWLPAWLVRNPQSEQVAAILTRYVKRIVAYRQTLLEQKKVPVYAAFYTPMTEADARGAYRKMIEADIALLRARIVSNNERVRSALVTYFNTPTAMFIEPSSMVLELPVNAFALIDEIMTIKRSDYDVAYAPRADDTPEQLELLASGLREENEALTAHGALLEQRIGLYGYTRERLNDINSGLHAPDDGVDEAVSDTDKWSPYDLSYPLDPEKSKTRIDQLVTTVARSAANFDASEQQARAHEIRRAIDRNYTMQVLERRRAELEYQLEKLRTPVTEVAQRVDRKLYDDSMVRLSITIGLSPQLEKRILSMNEELLEPDERRAQDALAATRFAVKWIFRPTANGTPPNVPEMVVREVVLPRGQVTDIYMPFTENDVSTQPEAVAGEENVLAFIRAANAYAGVYRVEVRVAELGDNSPVYNSRFKATVRIVARCLRDDALFEPMNNGESAAISTCCWKQTPPNRAFSEYVEELIALVEHGPFAHQQLVKSRAKSGLAFWEQLTAQVADRFPLLEMPLPLPPWGSSVPSQLIQTSLESPQTFRERFTFERIYADFRKRVGALIYYQVRDAKQRIKRQLPSAEDYTPDQLFNFYLDSTLKSVDGVSRLREVAAEYGLFRPNASVRAHDSRNELPARVDVEKVFSMAAILINSYETTQLTPPDTGTVDASIDLIRNEPTSINDESLVAILQRLGHPLSQALMTERERTFFGTVARDFALFTMSFRMQRRRDAPWLRAECTRTIPLGVAPYAEILNAEIDDCADEALGWMTVGRVQSEIGSGRGADKDLANMFWDVASYGDYQRLARNCLNSDNLAQLMRDRARVYQAKLFNGRVDIAYAYTEFKAIGGGVCCNDNVAKAVFEGVPSWMGAHSAVTDQPQPLVLQFFGATAIDRDVFKTASLLHTGSQPIHSNVDFNGLRHIVEESCARYNTLVDELERQTVPVSIADARKSAIAQRYVCEQLALVFNYFALASPPLEKFYAAHDIIRELEHGVRFKRLSFALPL